MISPALRDRGLTDRRRGLSSVRIRSMAASLSVPPHSTYGLFKLFNRIRQDLAKDRIVSFEDFRKSRVNGEALRSNSCVALPTGKQL